MKKLLFATFVAGLLASCMGGVSFSHFLHTDIAGWEKVDTLSFDVPKVNRGGLYALGLGLRITNKYPFQSLTLIVDRTVLPSRRRQSDTVACRLVSTGGDVMGKGVSLYQYHFHVKELQLNPGDSLHVVVRHNMKRELLPGVSDVGIDLTRVGN